nr:cytochrome c [uncultured Flavobacterium sp.]
MVKKLMFLGVVLFLVSCGKKDNSTSDFSKPVEVENKTSTSDYDPTKGEGKFTNVELAANLDHEMAKAGETVSNTKCIACHKLNDERLVGPGWAGVTERRAPEWIMNFITNPDPMIDKDPELQAQLELCLVRMPNQNVSDEEARQILEYMRKNDGIK